MNGQLFVTNVHVYHSRCVEWLIHRYQVAYQIVVNHSLFIVYGSLVTPSLVLRQLGDVFDRSGQLFVANRLLVTMVRADIM
jgi:hypothetical protein